MKSKELLMACAMVLASLVPATAGGPDLSAYGTPVDPTVPVVPLPATRNEPSSKNWPAHVCAEIHQVETTIAAGFGPDTRGISRIGLLTLEGRHCGIDVSKKTDADQAAMEDAHRGSQRRWDDIVGAAQSAASRDQDPIIVQVPQATAEPAAPRTMNCLTTRLGGGISTTNCR